MTLLFFFSQNAPTVNNQEMKKRQLKQHFMKPTMHEECHQIWNLSFPECHCTNVYIIISQTLVFGCQSLLAHSLLSFLLHCALFVGNHQCSSVVTHAENATGWWDTAPQDSYTLASFSASASTAHGKNNATRSASLVWDVVRCTRPLISTFFTHSSLSTVLAFCADLLLPVHFCFPFQFTNKHQREVNAIQRLEQVCVKGKKCFCSCMQIVVSFPPHATRGRSSARLSRAELTAALH